MTSLMHTADTRGSFHGVAQIVRFNWPFYAFAAAVTSSAMFTVHRLPLSAAASIALYAACALAAFWLAGSLVASWIVYDRSSLMTCAWIPAALGFRPSKWITIHAGLDETTPAVREILPGTHERVFDIFDPVEMSEPSIARARRLADLENHSSEPVDFRRLPALTGSVDAALLLLSAHELRSDEARLALLRELRRVLTAGGRVIVAEHLRDWANFLAFGPGFLHFHSRRTWKRGFSHAGFVVHDEFFITPFVRVFVLLASPKPGHQQRAKAGEQP